MQYTPRSRAGYIFFTSQTEGCIACGGSKFQMSLKLTNYPRPRSLPT